MYDIELVCFMLYGSVVHHQTEHMTVINPSLKNIKFTATYSNRREVKPIYRMNKQYVFRLHCYYYYYIH
jgi:hypothetical protein